MNLSSGRGSHGLSDSPFGHVDHEALHLHQIFFPRRHSTRLLLSTCLCPPPPTPRHARFPPSIPEKLSRPSATATAAASVPPPPRVPSRPSQVGLVPPPLPTPRVAALFVPSPGCLPPPRGPCLVRDSLAPRSRCGVLT